MKCYGYGTQDCYSVATKGNLCRSCHDEKVLADKDKELTDLREELAEAKARHDDEILRLNDIAVEKVRKLQSKLTAAQSKVARLKDALSDLMDWQNGPPLPTYEKGWTKAMENAEKALSLDAEPKEQIADASKLIDGASGCKHEWQDVHGDFFQCKHCSAVISSLPDSEGVE